VEKTEEKRDRERERERRGQMRWDLNWIGFRSSLKFGFSFFYEFKKKRSSLKFDPNI
jgi:hypothetical protein